MGVKAHTGLCFTLISGCLIAGNAVFICKYIRTFRSSSLPPSTGLEAVCNAEALISTYKSTQRYNSEDQQCLDISLNWFVGWLVVDLTTPFQ
jgi:hypothetical protein